MGLLVNLIFHFSVVRMEMHCNTSSLNVFANISAAIGPLLGTYLLTNGYKEHVFQITGTFYICAALIVLLLFRKVDLPKSQSSGIHFFKSYKSVLANRKYVQFLLFNSVGWFCYSQLFMALPFSSLPIMGWKIKLVCSICLMQY